MSDKRTADLTSEIFSEIDKDDVTSEENSHDSNDSKKGSKKDSKKDELKISKEFQENVIKFVKLDDLMRKKQQELSELREQKKPCEEYILKYLDSIDENVINITDGKLRKNKSETKTSINQDIIKKAISKKITDQKLLDEILKEMEESRPTNTHVNLKRTGVKIKKNKKPVANNKKA